MSHCTVARRIRPGLSSRFRCLQAHASHDRSFSVYRSPWQADSSARDPSHDFEKRLEQLRAHKDPSQWYPRIADAFPSQRLPIVQFRDRFEHLQKDETAKDEMVTIAGRVKSVRTAGSKLLFVTLEEDSQHSLQVVCNYRQLSEATGLELSDFKTQSRLIRRGDVFSATGHAHRTTAGELSILTTAMPTLLSPSLHQTPEQLDDAETRAHLRYVDMQVNPAAIATLRVRHLVEQHLQTFLNGRGFTSVKTPILNDQAGGAVARPFVTEASELPGQPLHLRIAPELWLKRLVVGGLEKVYEIGPAFRNEGVDLTHNPEFHICEFYEAYATLEELMATTEKLVRSLAERLAAEPNLSALEISPPSGFEKEFARYEFIPTIESTLNASLPDLSSPNTAEELQTLFKSHNLSLPENPTTPRLLDALCAEIIEPLTHKEPSFITHHPAALSPLSKTFRCPATNQLVAARAELFVKGREYANMYEEQNSPFAQRASFEAQTRLRKTSPTQQDLAPPPEVNSKHESEFEVGHAVDEPFVHALEWGLPPTGGWGCGVERFVMLFAGRERIADVLAFGTVRNVVGLGKGKGGARRGV